MKIPQSPVNNTLAIVIIGVLFFIFGFVTWINGALIPFLKITCELKSDTQAFLVVTASYMAYFFLALPSAAILKITGYKNGMALGLLVMVAGTLIFIPAASQRSFALFLTGLFLQGAGLALLQTASNPYVSVLGPIESAARRISIMGIANKAAGALSPLILGSLLLAGIDKTEKALESATDAGVRNLLLTEMAAKIKAPYLVMTVVLVVLAIMIYRSGLPEILESDKEKEKQKDAGSIFQFPHLWLGVFCIFFYVGAEVMAGDAIGIYGNAMGLPLKETRYFTAYTLTGMLAGYIAGIIFIPKYISQQTALKLSAVLGLILTFAIYFNTGYMAIMLIALLGLANALMWPAIFPLAIKGLGRFTKTGSALLIMGIAGGAVIPLLFGILKGNDTVGYRNAFFICLLPAYLYILFYAIKGYKVKPLTVSMQQKLPHV